MQLDFIFSIFVQFNFFKEKKFNFKEENIINVTDQLC